jgi:hypothetical protein
VWGGDLGSPRFSNVAHVLSYAQIGARGHCASPNWDLTSLPEKGVRWITSRSLGSELLTLSNRGHRSLFLKYQGLEVLKP